MYLLFTLALTGINITDSRLITPALVHLLTRGGKAGTCFFNMDKLFSTSTVNTLARTGIYITDTYYTYYLFIFLLVREKQHGVWYRQALVILLSVNTPSGTYRNTYHRLAPGTCSSSYS